MNTSPSNSSLLTRRNAKHLLNPPDTIRMIDMMPRSFGSISAMTRALFHYADLGFNVVWVQPFQQTGRMPITVPWSDEQQSGSCYAMTELLSDHFDVDGNVDDIREFTRIAKDKGIIPIFDLVAHHVAKEAVESRDNFFYAHQNWFKPYDPNAPYKDCREFDYANTSVRAEIMAFWKNYIDKYVKSYGFMGVRIDASLEIPLDVQRELNSYIRDACGDQHHVPPVIFAEILPAPGFDIMPFIHESKSGHQPGFNFATNNSYWTLGIFQLNLSGYMDSTGKLSGIGGGDGVGMVGYSGSHDQRTLIGTVTEEIARELVWRANPGINPSSPDFVRKVSDKMTEILPSMIVHHNDFVESLMKKKDALVSFLSYGGRYMLAGDEYGNTGIIDHCRFGSNLVFSNPPVCADDKRFRVSVFAENPAFELSWQLSLPKYDICQFVADENRILSSLPKQHIGCWVEHFDLDSGGELVVAEEPLSQLLHVKNLMVSIKHPSSGYVAPATIIIVSIANNIIPLRLSSFVEELRGKRKVTDSECYPVERFFTDPGSVFFVGKIDLIFDVPRVINQDCEQKITSRRVEQSVSCRFRNAISFFKLVTECESGFELVGQQEVVEPVALRRNVFGIGTCFPLAPGRRNRPSSSPASPGVLVYTPSDIGAQSPAR